MPAKGWPNLGFRIATALGLLMAVFASPIRVSRDDENSSSPHCLRRNFAVPGKFGSVHHRATRPIASPVSQVKAIASESEKERTDGTLYPDVLFTDTFPSLVSGPALLHPPVIHEPSSHPMRC